MSINGKIPVVVLEMMEKLRRQQAKEQVGKTSKKTGCGQPNEEPNTQTPRYQDPNTQTPRYQDPNTQTPKYQDPNTQIPKYQEPNTQIPKYQDPNTQTSRYQDSNSQIPKYQKPNTQTSKYPEPNTQIPKYHDPNNETSKYEDPNTQTSRYPDLNTQTLRYQDPPVEKIHHSPHTVNMHPKQAMHPPRYDHSQYYMRPDLPRFPDTFSTDHHMIPSLHSVNHHMPANLFQTYPPYHGYPMMPHECHPCAQGPLCHLTPPCTVPLESNPCSPSMKRQSSYLQMQLGSPSQQQPLSEFGDSHSPVYNLDNHLDLGVGSMVEVLVDGMPYYGVIRWLGQVYQNRDALSGIDTVAGIEMEQEHERFGDGNINSKQRFLCHPKRGHFVPLFQCRRDPRFIESHCVDHHYPQQQQSCSAAATFPDQEFGGIVCPSIPGAVPPPNNEKEIESLCGKFRGIQGHHNSCYLDATLFAMFTFTSVFDNLLFRPPPDPHSPHYTQVQTVLREEIVNPLRTNLFVRADKVMRLRHLLDELSDVSGLTSEEKDPEEFLTSLVAQILRAEPFLKLSSGQEAYHYQLFVEKDEKLKFPSVQQLFEQSFFTSDIKLKEAPSCLIIQMPRFGKSYKMYPRILPSQVLDITDVLENSPRMCTICGKLAEYECRRCFDQCGSGLQSIWYCRACLEISHSHATRTDHESCWRQLTLLDYFLYDSECPGSRIFMELFAVVCIETSHYVAFVKGGSGCDAPWCFFDSMADRKGERNGYNIPEMVPCPDLPYWLSDEGSHQLNNISDDRQLPEYAKRLMCDAYMVMYQSTDLMMYR